MYLYPTKAVIIVLVVILLGTAFKNGLGLFKKAVAALKADGIRVADLRAKTTIGTDSPFGLHPAIVVPPFEYGINNPYDFAVDLGANWDRSLRFIWTRAQPDLTISEYRWINDRQLCDIPDNMHLLANIFIGNPHLDSNYHQYAKENSFLPRSVPLYKRFVRAVVERYDGDGTDDMPGLRESIKHWQVDNEPPHRLSDYAEFLNITYQAIKEADPEAKVIIGGVPGMPPVSTYLKTFDKFYLPILDELVKAKTKSFDIFDFHWYGAAKGDYRGLKPVYDYIKEKLETRGLSPTGGYWITEMGTYSGDPFPIPVLNNCDYSFQTEEQQAADLFKRYVYALSLGIRKVFHGFGLREGFKYDKGFFDFTGLIYDGRFPHDKGKGVKKKAYYTYQLMSKKLAGCKWDRITILRNGKDNIYAFKFVKKSAGDPIYVAWWDYFDDPLYAQGNTRKRYFLADMEIANVTQVLTDRSGNRKSWQVRAVSGKIELLLQESPLLIEPQTE